MNSKLKNLLNKKIFNIGLIELSTELIAQTNKVSNKVAMLVDQQSWNAIFDLKNKN